MSPRICFGFAVLLGFSDDQNRKRWLGVVATCVLLFARKPRVSQSVGERGPRAGGWVRGRQEPDPPREARMRLLASALRRAAEWSGKEQSTGKGGRRLKNLSGWTTRRLATHLPFVRTQPCARKAAASPAAVFSSFLEIILLRDCSSTSLQISLEVWQLLGALKHSVTGVSQSFVYCCQLWFGGLRAVTAPSEGDASEIKTSAVRRKK